MPVSSMVFCDQVPSPEDTSRAASSSRCGGRTRCKAVVSIQPQETEYTTTRGASTSCWEGPVPHKQLITAGSTTTAASHAAKSIVKQAVQCSHHPTALDDSRAQRRTRRDGPTNKQQQRAHRHGEIPKGGRTGRKEGMGGKCTRRRRGDMYAQGTRQELVFPAPRHCATRSDMAQHHGRPMGAYPSANGIQSVRVGSVSREEKKKGRSRAGI